MSRVCKLSGKGPLSGNKVSHSNRKTRRKWRPNLQNKRLFIPELGRFVTLRLSARALKSVTKLGLLPYLRKQGLALKDIA